MKYLNTFNRVAQCVFRLFAWFIVVVLCYKAHCLSSPGWNLKEEKIEVWLALGVAYILGLQLMRPRVSRSVKPCEHPESN